MNQMPISKRVQNMASVAGPVLQFLNDPVWIERLKDPDACDFLFGNPQEFPLEGVTRALQTWAVPQNKDWFAYKLSEARAQEVISTALQQSHRIPFEPADIVMTTGAFAGLSATLGAIIDPGDEIIYISPPWFFYDMLITAYEGQPVRVSCDLNTFDLDLSAIRQAITSKTRGIIINSPNNPTGRIYPPETLEQLANLLSEASQANQRTIYLLSDEAYNRIVFDDAVYPSPTAYYPNSFLIYTYGKTLLTPGQRMGYIALPPTMPEREILRDGLTLSLVACGYAFPNALLQHALEDLQELSIDVVHLQAKRDRLVSALNGMGYKLNIPQGTFYLLVQPPLADTQAFLDLLAEYKVYCMNGSLFGLPGYFRISLTANDAMIERALPGFEKALQACSSTAAV
jgi:aspartate aminotransferase